MSNPSFNQIDITCNMSRYYFVSKSLQEISIIIILIFCLNIHVKLSLSSSYLLSIYSQKSVRWNQSNLLTPHLQIL